MKITDCEKRNQLWTVQFLQGREKFQILQLLANLNWGITAIQLQLEWQLKLNRFTSWTKFWPKTKSKHGADITLLVIGELKQRRRERRRLFGAPKFVKCRQRFCFFFFWRWCFCRRGCLGFQFTLYLNCKYQPQGLINDMQMSIYTRKFWYILSHSLHFADTKGDWRFTRPPQQVSRVPDYLYSI